MNELKDEIHKKSVIGLIPAAGMGTRISPLPCSKEIFPIGIWKKTGAYKDRPKAVCNYLLEKMHSAEIRKIFVILRNGKWDIPGYLLNGERFGLHIAYVVVAHTDSVAYSLDQAYHFVKDDLIALGFPDVLFREENAYEKLLDFQGANNVDVALGLFPADNPQKIDMVNVDDHGRITEIVTKPQNTHLNFSWGIAVWTPVFTKYLHDYLSKKNRFDHGKSELYMGDVIQQAIKEGLRVEGTIISNEPLLDIGTPEDLMRAEKYLEINTSDTYK